MGGGPGLWNPEATSTSLSRRRRRSRLPLLALLLTFVVIVAVYASGSSSPNDNEQLAYLDDVRPAVERSNNLGRELDGLRTSLSTLTRPILARRLDRLSREGTSIANAVQAVTPPRSLSTTHSLLVATMAVRADALAALITALDGALGGDPLAASADRLSQIGTDFTVSDRSYQLYVGRLGRPVEGATPPASVWMTDPSWWTPDNLRVLLATLRSKASLAPVHDLAIVTVATDPPPASMDGTNRVLPVVKGMHVDVVVANIGNVVQKQVSVVVTVTAASGAVDTARRFVDLDAGQRMSVQLGLLHPIVGEASTLRVDVAPVDGESAVDDNTRSFGFVMR
jgi:hypothetical protein